MRNYNIESDLKQEQFQTLKLVQGDRGNKIKINVYEDGQPVRLTGCSVTAKYKRADGEIINDGVIENIHDNSFDAVMDSSITKVAGTLKMLFTIEKDAVKVSAFLLLADVREGIGESSSSGGSAGGGEVTVDLTDYYKKIETYSRKEIDAQFKDITKNICNNLSLHSKIKSNSTLVISENIQLNNKIDINEINNLTVKSNIGKTIIEIDDDYIFNIINSNNISFENIIFKLNDTNTKHGAVVIQQSAKGISFKNCDFITNYSNGITVWCTIADKIIENFTVNLCSFDTGRMGIEFVNHIDDDVKRYKNIIICNNIFEQFGKMNEAMGISLSGYGENCVVENNILKAKTESSIGIELVGCCDSTFNNNAFIGKFKFFSASNDRIMSNLKIINNKMVEKYSNVETYIKNVKNSIISNNTLGYIRIINCDTLRIYNNYIYSSNSVAVQFDNSQNCSSANNLYSTYDSSINDTVLSFYGADCCNNISYNDELVRSKNSGGNYYKEIGNAKNNSVFQEKINNICFPYQSPLIINSKKTIENNVVSFEINYTFFGANGRTGGLTEYSFIFNNSDNNNIQSIMIKGSINYHLLLDPIPFLPKVNEIIKNDKINVTVVKNNTNLKITLTLTSLDDYNTCTAIIEDKCMNTIALKLI